MNSAAQREASADLFDVQANGTEGAPALREMAAERLASHRHRASAERIRQAQQAAAMVRERTEARRGSSGSLGSQRVRDAVAARFQASQSYREYLSAEAERAIAQAEAEAEVANRNARAVAEAQMQLLEELEQWQSPETGLREAAKEEQHAEARGELAHALADIAMGARELIAEPIFIPAATATPRILPALQNDANEKPVNEVSAAGLTVRLFEEIGTSRLKPGDLRLGKHVGASVAGEAEMSDLEEEIEFRRAPEFQPHIIETTAIPGNLIEFPRQLIAPRKARPRLAEGPLREDVAPEPQLRIFEVEAEQISVEPLSVAAIEPAAVAEWQTLLLDGNAARVPDAPAHAQAHFTMQPQTAPLELRLMAASVDGALLLTSLLAFGSVVVEVCGSSLRDLPQPLMAASAAGVLLTFFLAFQLLFFTFGEATPGMRYARIALCTFSDDNPTRKAMRRRIGAVLLAAAPVALGLAWTFLDEERLGWHDRMSRMYQRAY